MVVYEVEIFWLFDLWVGGVVGYGVEVCLMWICFG